MSESPSASVSSSRTVILVSESSSVRVSVSSTATGASFEALTEIVKKALKLDVPSEAVNVIVAGEL